MRSVARGCGFCGGGAGGIFGFFAGAVGVGFALEEGDHDLGAAVGVHQAAGGFLDGLLGSGSVAVAGSGGGGATGSRGGAGGRGGRVRRAWARRRVVNMAR